MPRVLQSRPTSEPPFFGVPPERLDYPSPDGDWNLVYHTPREFHMGAEGWRSKLFHNRRDVTAKHKGFLRIAGDKGFRCERDFQPWSYDSTVLTFVTWDERPVHLYEVAASSGYNLNYQTELVYSAQWAPDVDRLIITSATDGVLVDRAGEQHGVVPWELADYERPLIYWMKSGSCFFLLARKAGGSKTRVTFYRGEDGTPTEAYDLDPIDLVPYDWEKYVELPRDRFCLVSGPTMESVGGLLDVWCEVQFDQASSTLLLYVLRPVSTPYRENGRLLCKVERHWVAVELEEGPAR